MNRSFLWLAIVLVVGILAVGAVAVEALQGENAVIPGELKNLPTLKCIGLYWTVEDDANGNATATVEFREAGAKEWKKALPLWRVARQEVDLEANTVGGIKVIFLGSLQKWAEHVRAYLLEHYAENYLAGSIFNLKPGTNYEIRVSLEDPDGGDTTRTVRVSTRPVPRIPESGNIIHIHGGGQALAKAVARAKPGDIFLVHKGIYSGVVISASGTLERPIVIQPADDGEAVIHGPTPEEKKKAGKGIGIEVKGSHIRIHGLRIKSFHTGIRILPKEATDIAVTHCHITGTWTCIYTNGQNGYFADNILRGTYRGGNEGHGVEVHRGLGNVVCYNLISHVADAVRAQAGDCDVYGNDAIHCGDDAVETDYGGPNNRIFENRFSYTGANGISFQPYIGGPAYVIRNLVFNADENTIKDRYKSAGLILINNTLVARRNTALIECTYARNNLFITYGGESALRYHVEDFLRKPPTLDLDYNGYNANFEGYKWSRFNQPSHKPQPLTDFQGLTGLEPHGFTLTAQNCFKAPLPTKEQIHDVVMTWVGRPHPDFSLKAGSPAIDRGVVIPNIVEEYQGKAPDLGALEFGAPQPHFGPRKP